MEVAENPFKSRQLNIEKKMITVNIVHGSSYQIEWTQGMNAQQVLETVYNKLPPKTFSYSLHYFGAKYGYLVSMINETYETYNSLEAPYFFWEFLVNGNISPTGIDSTYLKDGDTISFEFTVYNPESNKESTTHTKFKSKK